MFENPNESVHALRLNSWENNVWRWKHTMGEPIFTKKGDL
jgi:hypothetical protein